ELRPFLPGLVELVGLAAQGDWASIERAQQLLGREAAAFDQLGTVLAVMASAGRLAAGQARDDDLLSLRRSPWGPEGLRRARQVRPRVLARGPHNDRLRKEFRDLLWENRALLEQAVGQALASGSLEDWASRWRFYEKVVRDNGGSVPEAFLRTLPRPGAGPPP